MRIAGHLFSGEAYEQGVVREAKEELNLDVPPDDYELLGDIDAEHDGADNFIRVYRIKWDSKKEILFNKNDFCEARWLTPTDVIHFMTKERFRTSTSIVLLKFFKDKL